VAELTHARIDVAPLLAAAARPECGAVNVFLGTTRDHHDGRCVLRLEYEAYDRMALAALAALEQAATTRFALSHCFVIHRLGEVPVTEASVAVVVSSAHRGAAFEASSWIMDALKRTVPIWKKEFFAEGDSHWVTGQKLEP
jgi:molybdopterin synthase catalytic subunit